MLTWTARSTSSGFTTVLLAHRRCWRCSRTPNDQRVSPSAEVSIIGASMNHQAKTVHARWAKDRRRMGERSAKDRRMMHGEERDEGKAKGERPEAKGERPEAKGQRPEV